MMLEDPPQQRAECCQASERTKHKEQQVGDLSIVYRTNECRVHTEHQHQERAADAGKDHGADGDGPSKKECDGTGIRHRT